MASKLEHILAGYLQSRACIYVLFLLPKKAKSFYNKTTNSSWRTAMRHFKNLSKDWLSFSPYVLDELPPRL